MGEKGGTGVNRRKIRKYRSARRNSGVKFAGILVIMIAAVICGYLTARFIIAPLLGYDTEVLKLDFPSRLSGFLDRAGDTQPDDEAGSQEEDSEGGEDSEGSGSDDADESGSDADKAASGGSASDTDSGYALQFGLFTTEDRARELADDLKKDGIDAEIREIDGKYKVTSPLVDTKDEAVKLLKDTDTSRVKDVFITVVK